MGVLGFVLIKEKELKKYQDGSFRTDYIKRLKEQIVILRTTIKDYEENPDKMIMGKRYSSQICDTLLKIIPCCKS